MVSSKPYIPVAAGDDLRIPGEEFLPQVETHFIRSAYVEQTFRISVMQPARRRGEAVSFPVVYATDANLTFDMLKGISYIIQSRGHDAPRFILVGIGYPGDSPSAGSVLRARDLTFPSYPKLSTERPEVDGVLMAPEGTKDFYGAEDFQRFISEELFHLIEARYPVLTGERVYFGHSGGGGFGLYTLFTRPMLFNKYVISSPGLIYNGVSSAGVRYENYDFVLQYARSFMASGRSLKGVRLYVSVGTEEEFEPGLANWQLTSSFYRLVALLRGSPIEGLDLAAEAFAGETHSTVWPMAFVHGLQSVFGTRAWGKHDVPWSCR